MPSKTLFIVAGVLVLAGFATIWSGFKGSARFNFGWPIGGSSLAICGSATGATAALGLICVLAGVVLFVISAIWRGSTPA